MWKGGTAWIWKGETAILTITTGLNETASRITVEVSDTGHGIEKENLLRIFDPFFTTKAEGAGLGLAVVHRIVEEHGGNIRVESSESRGTTVRIGFPRAEDRT